MTAVLPGQCGPIRAMTADNNHVALSSQLGIKRCVHGINNALGSFFEGKIVVVLQRPSRARMCCKRDAPFLRGKSFR
jgi:hypothetical protein